MYSGGCQCGRAGTLLMPAPPSAFTLRSGGEALTDYQFNKHAIHHLFCSKCGIKSFARGVGKDGGEMVAINTRCLDEVDPDKLNVQRFDGRAR